MFYNKLIKICVITKQKKDRFKPVPILIILIFRHYSLFDLRRVYLLTFRSLKRIMNTFAVQLQKDSI